MQKFCVLEGKINLCLLTEPEVVSYCVGYVVRTCEDIYFLVKRFSTGLGASVIACER